jgi:hypothetical protein
VLLVLFKVFAYLAMIFWPSQISLAERSHSSFTLVFLQVRKCFLFLVMPMRVISRKSKPMMVGLRTGILRLRALINDILF